MAENKSKDLLKLEASTAAVGSASCLESKLFVCKKDGPFSGSDAPLEKPTMLPLPKSQVPYGGLNEVGSNTEGILLLLAVLGKVKDFLGVISESNKKLLHDAKDNPDNYDIEVLSGKESKYIEMDLMLGIADLHTPEAVAAAESAIAGNQQPVPLSESSSGSENEDSSDECDDTKEDNKINEQDNEAGSQSVKFESKDAERDSSCKSSKKQKPKKRPKIVELA